MTTRRRVPVLDTEMSYLQEGAGPTTVVLLHGNPTSSFLWRSVLPALAGPGRRCVAPDLVGMGESGRPELDYTFADHARHLDAFLATLRGPDEDGLVLVGHDWGAVLALDHLTRRPEDVAGLVLCEGHLRPIESWAGTDPGFADLFGRLRTPGEGERLVMQENVFVEQVLPAGMHHELTPAERAAYAAPYPDPASRFPVWQWIQQIPIEGRPAAVDAVVRANQATLASTAVPVLLLTGEPGSVVTAEVVDEVRSAAPGVTIRSVGPGTHFLPEDQPEAIAREIDAWLGGSA